MGYGFTDQLADCCTIMSHFLSIDLWWEIMKPHRLMVLTRDVQNGKFLCTEDTETSLSARLYRTRENQIVRLMIDCKTR